VSSPYLNIQPAIVQFGKTDSVTPVLVSHNGSPIPVVEEVKFLGIIFDKKTLISSSLVLLEK